MYSLHEINFKWFESVNQLINNKLFKIASNYVRNATEEERKQPTLRKPYTN